MKNQKECLLGIQVKKGNNFSEWYTQVIIRGDLIDYYDVSGCYVIKPNGMAIWDNIKEYFSHKIKKDGVKDVYFPIFISKSALEKEKDHIDGFSPEVAWITKSGNSNLEEPIAIRPTSETVMYPIFSKWIKSYRDLPLKINQWCNVVRWEFNNPQPFIRTREFLWQEGHTVHISKEEADDQVNKIIKYYEELYTKILSIPVIIGKKSKKEQFPGAIYTMSIETFIPESGRGIQAATSHALGQKFSKIFGIEIDSLTSDERKNVWQTCWGISTRSIGIAVMIHGDDKGLIIPPKVAETQVIIIPCGINSKTNEENRTKIMGIVYKITKLLMDNKIRAYSDIRENYTTGWKYNDSELKGIPIRIEIGMRDILNNNITVFRRDTLTKETISIDEEIPKKIDNTLIQIQTSMYQMAKKKFEDSIKNAENLQEAIDFITNGKAINAPWCEDINCETKIRELTQINDEKTGKSLMGAKSLCIPIDQPKNLKEKKCIICNRQAISYGFFGRSY